MDLAPPRCDDKVLFVNPSLNIDLSMPCIMTSLVRNEFVHENRTHERRVPLQTGMNLAGVESLAIDKSHFVLTEMQ